MNRTVLVERPIAEPKEEEAVGVLMRTASMEGVVGMVASVESAVFKSCMFSTNAAGRVAPAPIANHQGRCSEVREVGKCCRKRVLSAESQQAVMWLGSSIFNRRSSGKCRDSCMHVRPSSDNIAIVCASSIEGSKGRVQALQALPKAKSISSSVAGKDIVQWGNPAGKMR